MADVDKESRTEQPTQKKIDEAKKDGIPQSRDFTGTVTLLVGIIALYATGPHMVRTMDKDYRHIYGLIANFDFTPVSIHNLLIDQFLVLGSALAPFVLSVMAAGLVVSLGQSGFSFNMERLAWKPERLNPINGFGRFFNKEAAVEAIKSSIKIVVVGLFAYRVIKDEIYPIMYLSEGGILEITSFIGHLSFKLVLHVCGILLIVAVLDLAFVKWNYLQNLKMSKEEVKEERKQSEGDPHIKGKMRRVAYERSRRRLKQVIPTADVVITNPTHYAVALKYDREKNAAPIVLAKGMDHLALTIKSLARENNIMLVENRPLARELYASTKEGMEIPESLYAAVAEVLAYVYSLKGKI